MEPRQARPPLAGPSESVSGSAPSPPRSAPLGSPPGWSRLDGSDCQACRPPSVSPTVTGEPAEQTMAGSWSHPRRHAAGLEAHLVHPARTDQRAFPNPTVGWCRRRECRVACRSNLRCRRRGLVGMTVATFRRHPPLKAGRFRRPMARRLDRFGGLAAGSASAGHLGRPRPSRGYAILRRVWL